MLNLDFDLAASATAVQYLDVKGNYLKYLKETTSTGNEISIATDNGGKLILKPGRGVRLDQTFGRLTIGQVGGAAMAISGQLAIGGADERIDDSLVVGAVSISGNVLVQQSNPSASVANGINSSSVGTSHVGITSATNHRRIVFLARATNTADICLSINTATMLSPIRLAPGEAWIETISPTNIWNAIAGAAGQNLDWWTDA